MANLFDEYEASSSRSHHVARPRSDLAQLPVVSGFVNTRLEDDTPIFNKQRINFNPSYPISHMCVSNNLLVLAMTNNVLLRVDLDHPDMHGEIELTKSVDDKIRGMYQDPTGRHLLVSMTSLENFYLSSNSKKPRSLAKLKGQQITCVGWNRQNVNDTSTAAILLGTNKGVILETEITSSEDSRFFQGSLDQYVKQLHSFRLGEDQPSTLTGIEFEKMPSTSLTEYRYFIMVTLPGRLYQFMGCVPASTEPPIFQHIFMKYEDVIERFLDLPGHFGYSCLQFYHARMRSLAKTFAWMAGPGVYYGNIDTSGAGGEDSVTVDTKLIQYPTDDNDTGASPLSIVLTAFHVLILYPDRLKAICVLNDQLVFEDNFSKRSDPVINMCKDPLKGSIWVFTSKAVFKYKLIRESRDVWQTFLEQGQYDLAKQYCQENPAHLDSVLTKQAESFFNSGKYEQSAETYALTRTSFEEVALKFIHLEQKESLKCFLLRKLAALKKEDRTQTTMLVSWIIELYLNELGALQERGEEIGERYEALQEQFHGFLTQPKIKFCVNENRSLVYDLISSHGNVEDMIFFAVLMQDYERVITHHLQHDNYSSALEMLSKQDDIELFYKFSPVLMQYIPKQTVDAWIGKSNKLDARKLIPALVQYDHERYEAQGNEAIRYLEFSVQVSGVRDRAIHNYLLCLYVKLQPDKLMKYLNFQGQNPDDVCYDLKYALRLCAGCQLHAACVHIYSTMGLYEEAVHLALQVDVDLAKQNADKPEDDEELRKKLWLKIARHVVEQEKDIRRAMEFLQECDLLKIEDVLPFFPDFFTIDHFKDAICTSLQEYNQHIDSLKSEMEEATQSAKEIREEIQGFRNRYAFVRAQDKCSCCNLPLMTRAFYAFPCAHKFHTDCLIVELLPHLTKTKRSLVEELQKKLSLRDSPVHTVAPPVADGAEPSLPTKQQTSKEKLADLVASECLYCGDVMIRCVDKPFIDENELSEVNNSWL